MAVLVCVASAGCNQCPSGLRMQDGRCICDRLSCAGCCAGDECLPGDTQFNCGANGVGCYTCGGLEHVCIPHQGCYELCTHRGCYGCCEPRVVRGGKVSVCVTGQGGDNDRYCGKDRAQCVQCTEEQTCWDGGCVPRG